MKQIKLKVFNYGSIKVIADFKDNGHEAYKLLNLLNNELAESHEGNLPLKTFYFLEYISKRTKELKRMINDEDAAYKREIRQAVEELY